MTQNVISKRTDMAYEVKQLAAVVARLKKKHGGDKGNKSKDEDSSYSQ